MTVHVMIDLETWGTQPGSALRSIGAVTFSPYGDGCEEKNFYANIGITSCEAIGLTVDQATVDWWRSQPADSRARLDVDPQSFGDVARAFEKWWREVEGTYVWSNGANFDEVLWRVACAHIKYGVPWKYWNVRDTRTCWHLARLNHRSVPFDGVQHDALADARHQAKCVTQAYSKLGIKREVA